MTVLDTRDGHVLAEWPTDDGAQLAVLAGLLVVGHRDAESGVEVVAHDPTTGGERWRYAEPLVEDPTAVADAMTEHFWTFFAAGDVLAFGNGGGLTLLSPTGTVVRDGLRCGRQGREHRRRPRDRRARSQPATPALATRRRRRSCPRTATPPATVCSTGAC